MSAIASMTFLATVSSGPSGTRKVRISLPLVPDLVDGRRYFLPADLPPPEGQDLRGLSRPQRRGALWTSHDRGGPARRRSIRFEAEVARDLERAAELVGDPATNVPSALGALWLVHEDSDAR